MQKIQNDRKNRKICIKTCISYHRLEGFFVRWSAAMFTSETRPARTVKKTPAFLMVQLPVGMHDSIMRAQNNVIWWGIGCLVMRRCRAKLLRRALPEPLLDPKFQCLPIPERVSANWTEGPTGRGSPFRYSEHC